MLETKYIVCTENRKIEVGLSYKFSIYFTKCLGKDCGT